MVHVRTVNEKTEIFGNQGALFMNAMTWWDHTTGSVWSQVWGRAIEGPLKGTELELLPSQTVPWGTWKTQHPDSLLMVNDLSRFRLGRGEYFQPNYVIGIALNGMARAYPYKIAEQERIINDSIGDLPLLVLVDPETRSVSTFLRVVDDRTLTFALDGKVDGEILVDQETGSRWDPILGMATSGPLQGQVLRSAPYVPAFYRSWEDFYPHTTFYGEQ